MNYSFQVLVEQGLGKFIDDDFIRTTSREMQEAMDMTQEEMDRAAHHLLMLTQDGDGTAVRTPALSGAAIRRPGGQPLTLALNSAFNEVDHVPQSRHKS
jgi:hypothetical protein